MSRTQQGKMYKPTGVDGKVRKGLFKGIIVLLGDDMSKDPVAEVCIKGPPSPEQLSHWHLCDGAWHLPL